ncbi:MAG: insulinase family protein [Bacteroidaceae bacterium]|nr:insulinase family protein [Bacteroidaceae bacterium]
MEINSFTLANGLRLLHSYDASTQMVCLNTLFKVGSRNESPEHTGFAHLFEHLMFGGSVNIPDFEMPLQNACGENNAYTSTDYTNYYTIIPAQNVETAFWLESDRMLSLAFTPQSLEVQRKVVMEEFKLNYINQPYGDISHILAALCYKQHPYRWPTIGLKLSHIADATMDDVKQFFYRFYRPSNAILAITGNISWDDALRLTEKWYGDIPMKKKMKNEECRMKNESYSSPVQSKIHSSFGSEATILHSSFITPEPPQLRQRRKTVHRNVPHSVLLMAFHIPARMHPDFQVCDMISDVLANGKSARFWRDLVEGKRLFLSLDAYVSGRIDSGQLIIEGIPAEGVDMHDAEAAIWDELDRLRHELVPEQEIQKLKNKYEASSAMQCTEYTQRAERLAYFEMLGDASLINQDIPLYCKTTATDLRRVSRQILTRKNSSILYYLSKTTDGAE